MLRQERAARGANLHDKPLSRGQERFIAGIAVVFFTLLLAPIAYVAYLALDLLWRALSSSQTFHEFILGQPALALAIALTFIGLVSLPATYVFYRVRVVRAKWHSLGREKRPWRLFGLKAAASDKFMRALLHASVISLLAFLLIYSGSNAREGVDGGSIVNVGLSLALCAAIWLIVSASLYGNRLHKLERKFNAIMPTNGAQPAGEIAHVVAKLRRSSVSVMAALALIWGAFATVALISEALQPLEAVAAIFAVVSGLISVLMYKSLSIRMVSLIRPQALVKAKGHAKDDKATKPRAGLASLLAILGLALAVPLFIEALKVSSFKPLVLLVVLVALTALVSVLDVVPLTSKVTLSAAEGVLLVTVVLMGAAVAVLAVVVYAFSYFGSLYILSVSGRKRDLPPARLSGALISAFSGVWACLAAGALFSQLQGTGNIALTEPTFYLSFVLAGVVFVAFDHLGKPIIAIRDKCSWIDLLKIELRSLLPVDALVITGSLLAVALFASLSYPLNIAALGLFAIIAPAAATLIRIKLGYVSEPQRKEVQTAKQ